jgi:predicted helicase
VYSRLVMNRTVAVSFAKKFKASQHVADEFRTLHRELTAYFNETVEHL